MNAVIILLTGIAFYILFRLGRILLVNSGRLKGDKISAVFTTLELVMWMLYFFWSIDRLLGGKSYYNVLFVGLVFLLVALLAWFYVKDLVAGALFKIQYNPKPGKYLQAGKVEGVIRKTGATHLTLESANGEWIKVPFSRLQGGIITQANRKEHTGDYRIRLRLGKKMLKEEAMDRIRTSVLQNPFCTFKKPVRIKQLDEDADGYTCEVTLTAIEGRFLDRIEKKLKEDVLATDI